MSIDLIATALITHTTGLRVPVILAALNSSHIVVLPGDLRLEFMILQNDLPYPPLLLQGVSSRLILGNRRMMAVLYGRSEMNSFSSHFLSD